MHACAWMCPGTGAESLSLTKHTCGMLLPYTLSTSVKKLFKAVWCHRLLDSLKLGFLLLFSKLVAGGDF